MAETLTSLKTLESMVTLILKEHPETRTSDRKLFLKVWEMVTGIPAYKVTLAEAMGSSQYPNYESVGRARRKALEKNPELADTNTTAHRHEQMEVFIDYATR